MLNSEDTVLVVIDVQERLVPSMHEKESLLKNLKILLQGAQALGVPIILTEQNPRGLGPTLPEIAALMPGVQPTLKMCFSCCDEKPFLDELGAIGRESILLAGIETHVCVYQTAVALAAKGYKVQVVADAVSSRTAANKSIGLDRARAEGAGITSTETVLFELLKKAEGDRFKIILGLVK